MERRIDEIWSEQVVDETRLYEIYPRSMSGWSVDYDHRSRSAALLRRELIKEQPTPIFNLFSICSAIPAYYACTSFRTRSCFVLMKSTQS